MNKVKKILILLMIVLIITLYNAFFINPKQIKVNKEIIISKKIPADMNNFSILFFSDLHYGTSIKEEELKSLIDQINLYGVDLILFGGDLIDHYSMNVLSEKEEKTFIKILSTLKANKGKYAILGEHDLDSALSKENISRILNESGFEILNNKNVKIYGDNNSYINLVGIDSLIAGNPDLKKSYQDIDDKTYTISLCHTPDIYANINSKQTDLLLTGHSHAMQVYLPLISSYFTNEGAINYNRGTYNNKDYRMDVSSGVGTSEKNIRLLADASITIYKLKTSTS